MASQRGPLYAAQDHFRVDRDPTTIADWPKFDPNSDHVPSLGQKIGSFPMNQNVRVLDKIMARILSGEQSHRNSPEAGRPSPE
jgi:hypothetical protein